MPRKLYFFVFAKFNLFGKGKYRSLLQSDFVTFCEYPERKKSMFHILFKIYTAMFDGFLNSFFDKCLRLVRHLNKLQKAEFAVIETNRFVCVEYE